MTGIIRTNAAAGTCQNGLGITQQRTVSGDKRPHRLMRLHIQPQRVARTHLRALAALAAHGASHFQHPLRALGAAGNQGMRPPEQKQSARGLGDGRIPVFLQPAHAGTADDQSEILAASVETG